MASVPQVILFEQGTVCPLKWLCHGSVYLLNYSEAQLRPPPKNVLCYPSDLNEGHSDKPCVASRERKRAWAAVSKEVCQ